MALLENNMHLYEVLTIRLIMRNWEECNKRGLPMKYAVEVFHDVTGCVRLTKGENNGNE